MGFAVLLTLFAIQNGMPVTINFLSWSGNTSFAIVVLGSAGAGVLIALLSQVMVQIRLRLALHKSKNRVHHLEKALAKTEILNRDIHFEEKVAADRVL